MKAFFVYFIEELSFTTFLCIFCQRMKVSVKQHRVRLERIWELIISGLFYPGTSPLPVFSPPRIQERLNLATVEPPLGPPSK